MKNNQESVNINILKSLEPDIRKLLKRADVWKTLDVDYYPPRVERLYTTFGEYRIFLHIIHHTDEECLFHKHRWPAAFKQVDGCYEMGITYSEEDVDSLVAHNLPILSKFVIDTGSYYEMTQTDCLHYVKPITKTSASIMITKDLYADDRKEANTLVLSELSEERKLEILLLFENYMRVRTEYICGVCGQSHKTEELANTCENTHIRIQPTNWWLIPFIGLFLIIFYSFKSDRYHIKYEEKSIMTSLKRDWIFLSPMLTMIITILILITLSHYGKS